MTRFYAFVLCFMVGFPLIAGAEEYKNVAVSYEFYKSEKLIDTGFMLAAAKNDRILSPVGSDNKPARGYPVIDCKKDGKGGTFKSEIVSSGTEVRARGNGEGKIKIKASFYELDPNYVMPETSDIDLVDNCENIRAPKVQKYSEDSTFDLDSNPEHHVMELGGGYIVKVQIRAVEA